VVTVPRFSAVGVSHVGLVRGNNEDSGFAGHACLLIADGVGGNAAGEVASATAAYVVSASVLARSGAGADAFEVLDSATRLAQQQILLGAQRDPRCAGMATTLTAVVTDGSRFALVHVGDSRGYLFRDGVLHRITSDHTFVQQLVDDGSLTAEAARTHPWRHMVLRSLDGNVHETGDLTELDLRVGDRVLLASDGLSDLVTDERVARVLGRHTDEEAADLLVEAALVAGGRDNVTCVLATVVDGDPVTGDGMLLGAARDPRVVVDPAAVRLPRSA
jgi:serine/threonine protein phosphatase PrpC